MESGVKKRLWSSQLLFLGILVYFVVIALSCSIGALGAVEDPKLVLEMHFDEEGEMAKDTSNFHNDGSLHECTWVTEGIAGGALRFNGERSFVRIQNSESLALTKGFTLEVWFKPAVELGGRLSPRMTLLSKSGQWHRGWYLQYHDYWGNGRWLLAMNVGGKMESNAAGYLTAEPADKWVYIVATYDGKKARLYRNGEPGFSTSLQGDIDVTGDPLLIGRTTWGGHYAKGLIDEVRIWDGALTGEEIRKRYKSLIGIKKGLLTRPSAKRNPFLQVDGKPFFPIGIYCAIDTDDNLKALSEAGFNLIQPRTIAAVPDIASWRRLLDKAAAYNLKIFATLWDPPHGQWWATDLNPNEVVAEYLKRFGKPNDVADTAADRERKIGFLKELVPAIRDHPALLVWETCDEISQFKVPVEGLLEGYHLLKSLDPAHAVWLNHSAAVTSLTELKLYNQCADVVSYDYYPGGGRAMLRIGELTELLSKSVDYQKPVWMVLQADTPVGGSFPTCEALRFMTYSSIVQGATGIIYFGQDITVGWTPEFRKAIMGIVRELKVLSPVFTGGVPYAGEITALYDTHQVHIKGICLKHDNAYYIVCLNVEEVKNPTMVEFELPFGSGADNNVEVLFEDRSIKLMDSRFRDRFGSFDVHIYKIARVK